MLEMIYRAGLTQPSPHAAAPCTTPGPCSESSRAEPGGAAAAGAVRPLHHDARDLPRQHRRSGGCAHAPQRPHEWRRAGHSDGARDEAQTPCGAQDVVAQVAIESKAGKV